MNVLWLLLVIFAAGVAVGIAVGQWWWMHRRQGGEHDG